MLLLVSAVASGRTVVNEGSHHQLGEMQDDLVRLQKQVKEQNKEIKTIQNAVKERL